MISWDRSNNNIEWGVILAWINRIIQKKVDRKMMSLYILIFKFGRKIECVNKYINSLKSSIMFSVIKEHYCENSIIVLKI